MMLHLSQRDSRWSQVKLGASSLTVGRYGCTTTCISMLTSLFNCTVLPGEIAHNAANYTKDGLVIWQALSFKKVAFEKRLYGFQPNEIDESIKHPKKAVILQVNDGAHWVVAIRKAYFGNDYIVLDPWTGKKVGARAAYKNITGSAHFIAK
jgi:hypothetical protein